MLTPEILESLSRKYNLTLSGYAPLQQPHSFELFEEWLEQKHHGELQYMEKHKDLRKTPQLIQPQAKSAFVFAQEYLPHPNPKNHSAAAEIALYAQGEDYHFWFKEKLTKLAQDLSSHTTDHLFHCYTDSAPILERDLAHRAGLGWIGKNTCLIHPKKGSLFFIGEIFTSFDVATWSTPDLISDHCGKCNKCIEICPTQAIEEPRVLNATKCISYWTIESRTLPPEPLREKFQDWLFGCDLCQTVCPWNIKFNKELSSLQTQKQARDPAIVREQLLTELKFILTSSGKKLTKHFEHSPLMRAGPFGLKRNAIIVATNKKLIELRQEIQAYLEHEKLGPLVEWSLQKLK